MKITLLSVITALAAATVSQAVPAPAPEAVAGRPRYYYPQVIRRQEPENDATPTSKGAIDPFAVIGGVLGGTGNAESTPEPTPRGGSKSSDEETDTDTTKSKGGSTEDKDTDTLGGGPTPTRDSDPSETGESGGVVSGLLGDVTSALFTPTGTDDSESSEPTTSVVLGLSSIVNDLTDGPTPGPTITDGPTPTQGSDNPDPTDDSTTGGGLISSLVDNVSDILGPATTPILDIGTGLPITTPSIIPDIDLPITTPTIIPDIDLPITTPSAIPDIDLPITTTPIRLPDDGPSITTPGFTPPISEGPPSTTHGPTAGPPEPPTTTPGVTGPGTGGTTEQPPPPSTTAGLPPSDTSKAPVTSEPTAAAPTSAEPSVSASSPASSGPASIIPTGSNTATALSAETSILSATSQPTEVPQSSASVLPSSLPRIIQPDTGVPDAPANSVLIQLGFTYGLNYNFVVGSTTAVSQIFTFLPAGVAHGVEVAKDQVLMSYLQPYNTLPTLGYITTLAMAYIPKDDVNNLALALLNPNSLLYNNPNPSVNTLMKMIDPSIPLLAGQTVAGGSPISTTNGAASTSGNGNGGGAAGGENGGSSGVRPSSVGIGVGVVAGAAVYGAAMFFVARRYKKKKARHQRSNSVQSGSTGSSMSRANEESDLMSGGRDTYGTRLTSAQSNQPMQGRGSPHSDRSNDTGRNYISPPVMAENSLGWN